MDRIKIPFFSLLVLMSCYWPKLSLAASPSIHLNGPSGLIRNGGVVPVEVQISSDGQQMNAAQVRVQFSPSLLRVVGVSRAQSMFTLWPEEPKWNNATGQVTLVGGRPGGLIAAGGRVATIYFATVGTGLLSVVAGGGSSALYLNDGVATSVKLPPVKIELQVSDALVGGIQLRSHTHPQSISWSAGHSIDVQWGVEPDTQYSYQLSPAIEEVPDDIPENQIGQVTYDNQADGVYFFTIKNRGADGSWRSVIQRPFLLDSRPPEAFVISRPDPASIGGRAYITWLAQDVTSGIAKYELKVGKHVQGTVSSPVLIKPLWAGQRLTVTAFDQAGNQQTSVLDLAGGTWVSLGLGVGVVGLLALIGGGVWWHRRRR